AEATLPLDQRLAAVGTFLAGGLGRGARRGGRRAALSGGGTLGAGLDVFAVGIAGAADERPAPAAAPGQGLAAVGTGAQVLLDHLDHAGGHGAVAGGLALGGGDHLHVALDVLAGRVAAAARSEERRVGKEGRSGWARCGGVKN